jgi:hypothetical protein
MSEPYFASGDGSASEALLDVNPTITVPPSGVFQICNILATYAGAGYIRIRETDLNGAELYRIRFAADGTIPCDFTTAPLTFKGGKNGRTLVITQQGNFPNSVTISGT